MAEDLFSDSLETRFDEYAPLAARMRPAALEEFVGQEHLLGRGSPLRNQIENEALASLILWGPPGTGKTSLAGMVAASARARYKELSAVNATVAEVRRTIAEAREVLAGSGRPTILFIDEIHRFNKGQQDALLPAVENRWITLIGATTENPYFEVIPALMSRCMLLRLEPLGPEQILSILRRAMADGTRGLGKHGVTVDAGALEHIAGISGGDARSALNALEVCVMGATASGTDRVDADMAARFLQRPRVRYDKGGDQHHDVVSAFIKSIRGSDPDAGLFWLARMLQGGEDPKFIARRIIILASEDVGNADPMGLVVAVAAARALEQVGLPEAALNLAQAVTYLAAAPKSNAVTTALARATDAVGGLSGAQVPLHLRSHLPRGSTGAGQPGYRSPHDYPEGWVDQEYLPGEVVSPVFYEPTGRGEEAGIAQRLAGLRARRSGRGKAANRE